MPTAIQCFPSLSSLWPLLVFDTGYQLFCVPRVNRVEHLNLLTKELSTQVHGVASTLSFSSPCVLTGMTHPSLWYCVPQHGCVWKLPSFIQYRHLRPHLDEWLTVVAVAVLAVCGQNKQKIQKADWCWKRADAWKLCLSDFGSQCLWMPDVPTDFQWSAFMCRCVFVSKGMV